MIIIIGLGNPGTKYEQTRHNLGFRVVDLLAGVIQWETKFDSLFLKLNDVILAKPQTFMNLSGKAVAQVRKYYPDADLVVIHDELDLPLGTIKIMKNVSSAGHNGVQSIIDELGTKDFVRIRMGINNPVTRQQAPEAAGNGEQAKGQTPSEDYVLQKFSQDEETIVNELLEKAKGAIETLQTDSLEATQSQYNG